MANAEIIAIGTELLLGQIVDTNSSWMAQRLTNVGVDLFYKTIVGDNPARMKDTIDQALARSDMIITCGGLGPTQDDLTRESIAAATGRRLVKDPGLLEQIEKRFRSRGLIMSDNNERQAYIPDGAIPIENPNGTAPSFIVEDSRGVVFALPGVPFELKWLFDNELVPYAQRKFGLSDVITYRVIKVANIGESGVDDLIGHLIANSTNPTVGVLAHPGQVDVRVAAKAAGKEEAYKLIAPVEDEIRRIIGNNIFAVDDESMEDVVEGLLYGKDATIAVYEDITGGLLAESIQKAAADQFQGAIVGRQTGSIDRVLSYSRCPDSRDALFRDPEALTDELAWSVRSYCETTIGLALHGELDLSDKAENLARGRTYISVTDGDRFERRKYNYSGKGRPDRTRLILNALDLVRSAMIDGGF